MGPKRWLALVVTLAILPAGSFGGPLGTPDQCVPTHLPEFRTWTLRAAQSMDISDETGKTWPALYAIFVARGQPIATIWVGALLVSVDPEPENREAPGWHDPGAVLPDTTIRTERRQTCQWFQPLREKSS